MIITFYSYKGGVGRSMALANVAEWLYRQGLRVIVADWDLEAPGLESYFEPDPARRAALGEGRGIIDMLVSYRSAHGSLHPLQATAPSKDAGATTGEARGDGLPDEEKLSLLRTVLPSLAFFLQPLEDSPRPTAQGSEPGLWLLSAGARQGERFAEYARSVHGFDWPGFYTEHNGAVFFAWLREELEKFADVVLVDSRTGVTEMSGVCTRDLAHLVVSFCAPNDANLHGVLRMTRWFLDPDLEAFRSGRRLRALLVPSRVDHQSETLEHNLFKARFHEGVARLRELDPEADASAWWDLQIRYVSRYSFHELIVVGRQGENEKLQEDLDRLGAYIATRYIAHASGRLGPLFSRRLGEKLRKLLEQGGIDASLQAEESFTRLPLDAQARSLALLARLMKLARPEEGGAITPIRQPVSAFDEGDRARITGLVGVGLVQVVPDEEGIDCLQLSNPAYAERWNRLLDFVRRDSAFLVWRQQLNVYLRDFRQHPDDPAALLAGQILGEAKRYAETRSSDLTAEERRYIQKSEARAEDVRRVEAERVAVEQSARAAVTAARRESTGLRWIGLAFGAVVVALIGWAVYQGRTSAERDRHAKELATIQKDAEAALARDDYLGAIEKLDSALRIVPDDAAFLLKRGMAKVTASRLPGQGQLLSEGIADLGRSIQLNPQADAYHARAGALVRRKAAGDEDAAVADFARAVELDGANAGLIYERARFQESRGQPALALQDYSRALEINPQYIDAYFNRGLLLAADGKRDLAIADFRKVVGVGGDPVLAQAANTELQRLGQSQVAARKPVVTVQYADSADASLVKQLQPTLAREDLVVLDGHLRPERSAGDVRYSFPEDQATAVRVKARTEAALVAYGVRLSLETIYVDAKRVSQATRGQVELWLPPMATGYKVALFWCESSGPAAERIAQSLLSAKGAKWRGQWNVRMLARDRNEGTPGYRVTGYEIRTSSDAEESAAEELKDWMAGIVGSSTIQKRRSTLDTPGYLSIFVCPNALPTSLRK